MTAARPRHQIGTAGALRVVQVPEGVPVRPSHRGRGTGQRTGGLNGAQELDAAIAQREPAAELQPDLVPDGEPI
jgi:hypothetical protein